MTASPIRTPAGSRGSARVLSPPSRVAPGGSALAVAAAVVASTAVGVAGSVAAVHEWGPLVVHRPVAHEGSVVLGVGLAAWIGLAALLRRVAGAQLVIQLAAYVTVGLATASNIGRVHAVVAVTAGFAMFAALVDWYPARRWPARRHAVALLALVPVLVGQWGYARLASAPLAVAGALVGFVLVDLYARRPWLIEPADTWLRHAVPDAVRRAGARALALVLGTAVVIGRVAAHAYSSLRQAVGTPIGRTVMVATGVAMVWLPVMWRLTYPFDPTRTVLGVNDVPLHLAAASELRLWPFDPQVPHFLLHLLVAVTTPVFGAHLAATLVLGAAVAATVVAGAALVGEPDGTGGRLSRQAALAVTACVMVMETPAMALVLVGALPGSTIFQTIHAWYSPTWVIALPISIASVVIAGRVARVPADAPIPRRSLAVLGVMSVMGAVAKPSFLLCFVPGLVAYLLLLRTRPGRLATILCCVALPVAPVLAWQWHYLGHNQTEIGGGGVRFDPVAAPPFGWSAIGWSFFLPMVWLPVAAVVARGRFLRDPAVQLLSSCTVFAVAIMLTLVDTGPRTGHGNLGVPAQVCAWLLVLLSVRSVASEVVSWPPYRRRGPVGVLLGALLVAFLLGGSVTLLDALGWWDVPIEWQVG